MSYGGMGDFDLAVRSQEGIWISCEQSGKLLWYEAPKVSTGLVFAVGRPFLPMAADRKLPLVSGPGGLPLYVTEGGPQSPLMEWLQSAGGMSALEALGLRDGDALHVCRNSASLFIVPRSDEENLALINTLAAFVVQLPPDLPVELGEGEEFVDGLALDPNRLPSEFRHLVPLIRKWSIGDDVERAEKEEGASREELQELYETVAPLFEAIDVYLNELEASGEPYPSEGHLLSWLAEAAAEAQVDLRRRRR